MKQRKLLPLLLCCALLLSFAACRQKPRHEHTFTDWTTWKAATCSEEGTLRRYCTKCPAIATRITEMLPHTPGEYTICKECGHVDFDPDADFVELGIPTTQWYGKKVLANFPWDLKLWNGKIYRAAGNYSAHNASTPIWAFDLASQSWENTAWVAEEAIHRFVEIGGKLCTPGIDPTGGWDMGNYYVLEENGWQQIRNLPNGVHCFDLIEFDGKIFAGLGTEVPENTVAVSTDGGKSFSFVPLYEDGKPLDTSSLQWMRTYEFMEYNNTLYALISGRLGIGNKTMLFRYEDNKMVYIDNGYQYVGGLSHNASYIPGKFEFDGALYLTCNYLYAVTDFSDINTRVKVSMPKGETVTDAFLKDGTIYVLSYYKPWDKPYHVRIYASTTGKAGSFTEVLSFLYDVKPCSFEFDGTYFYVGLGGSNVTNAKNGMVVRAKPGIQITY